MAAETTLTVDVPIVGRVEMHGVGPWRVRSSSGFSFDVVDSTGRTTNPTVWRSMPGGSGGGVKADRSCTYSKSAVPNMIVAAANAALAQKAA